MVALWEKLVRRALIKYVVIVQERRKREKEAYHTHTHTHTHSLTHTHTHTHTHAHTHTHTHFLFNAFSHPLLHFTMRCRFCVAPWKGMCRTLTTTRRLPARSLLPSSRCVRFVLHYSGCMMCTFFFPTFLSVRCGLEHLTHTHARTHTHTLSLELAKRTVMCDLRKFALLLAVVLGCSLLLSLCFSSFPACLSC